MKDIEFLIGNLGEFGLNKYCLITKLVNFFSDDKLFLKNIHEKCLPEKIKFRPLLIGYWVPEIGDYYFGTSKPNLGKSDEYYIDNFYKEYRILNSVEYRIKKLNYERKN